MTRAAYKAFKIDADGRVTLVDCDCMQCRPAGNYGVAAKCQEPPVAIWDPPAMLPEIVATGWPTRGLPSTARAIMSIVPEKKTPQPQPQPADPRSGGVARAVARINAPYEPRCGCWQQET